MEALWKENVDRGYFMELCRVSLLISINCDWNSQDMWRENRS